MALKSSTETRLDFYRRMYLIRRTEEMLAERYKEQEMRTPAHFGVGQEAVAVGVCSTLGTKDHVYSHHRCHNHYLACDGDIGQLAAELYGRETGCARGRGGSVHLTQKDKGFIISSAILGQTVAVAAGSAFAFHLDAKPYVAVTFFGEAACEEGIVYETMNFAAIHKLPLLFVCENNGYSTESPLAARQPEGTSLCRRAESFSIPTMSVDGNDVEAVHAAAAALTESIRKGGGPAFLECSTYRWLEHVGPYFDHEMQRTYRTREELEAWQKRCPVAQQRTRLIDDCSMTDTAVEEVEQDIERIIEDAITAAKAAPWPDVEQLMKG
ncbi:MAG: thiamine pyrophosphate-dependent dehydrogenase E1 component subunit alpha [Rhodospirillales bacterium]